MTDKILNYIKDNFPTIPAFLVGILGLFILFATIDSFVEKFAPKASYRLIPYLIISVMWLIFWLYERTHLPKNKKGYIGIVVCVETENDKQKNRLKNDFVKRLEKLIASKNLKKTINVILLENYQVKYVIRVFNEYARNKQSKKADKNWQKIRKRTRGHFFIYGSFKERQDGENKYYLDLEALVTHAPVQLPTKKQIVQDFLSVWYKQISFQEKIEFKGFLLAADAIFIAVQYVVGIAALVSGDVSLALELHTGLDNDPYFSRFSPLPPNLQNVKKRLKTLLSEENHLMARASFEKGMFAETERYMNQSLSIEPNYGAYLLESIIEFLHMNNPDEALKSVYRAKDIEKSDGTWRYNEGFLLMYMERFPEALRVYDKIINTSFINEKAVLLQIYKFNKDFLKKHPEKIQSYFIIGFLKYKKDLNYPEGLEYLEKFISESTSKDKYRILKDNAEVYHRELRKIMNL